VLTLTIKNAFQGYSLARLRILAVICASVLSGPLFIKFPYVHSFWKEFAPIYGSFIIILVLWEIEVFYITKFIFLARTDLGKSQIVLRLFPAFLINILVFYWLGHLEAKVNESFFLILVAVLGLRAITQGLKIACFSNYAAFCASIVICALSILSLALSSGSWAWQSVFLALALVAGYGADFLINKISPLKKTELLSYNIVTAPRLYLRLHSFMLFAGPVIILMMVYLKQLGSSYLLVVLSLAPVLRAAEKGRSLESSSQIEPESLSQLTRLSVYSSLSFILALISAIFVSV
jgi:hypothetical protein